MLESRKAKSYNENKPETIIGPGTKVTGELYSKGTVHIQGEVSGQIRTEDSIVVQQSGKVQADIIGGQVVINGEVHGNVFAHDLLRIEATGRVVGDITAPRISIAEGVLFEGKCTMKPPGQMKIPLPQKPAAAKAQDAPQTSKGTKG